MKSKNGSWVVRVRCTIDKEMICADCTEEQAKDEPLLYSISETDISVVDWDILSVKPNK